MNQTCKHRLFPTINCRVEYLLRVAGDAHAFCGQCSGRSLTAFIRKEDSNGKVLGLEALAGDCVGHVCVRCLAKSCELCASFHPRLLCVSLLSCPLRVPGRNASRRQDGIETQAWTLRRVCTDFSGVELLVLIFLREDEVHSFDAADVSAL